MKKLATIPSFLLTKELSTQLKLQNQHYVILIPKKFVNSSELTFDLFLNNNTLSLVGRSNPRVTTTTKSRGVAM